MRTLTDEEANEIYQKVSALSQGRKGYIKKNWSDDEARLLKWAVLTYTKQKGIANFNLVRIKHINNWFQSMNDWQNISRLVPGRNDNQCHYKWQSEYKQIP